MLSCFRRRSRLFERRSQRHTRCHWWEVVPTLAWPRRRQPGVPTSTLTRSWPTPSALRPCRLPICLVLQSTPLPWRGRFLKVCKPHLPCSLPQAKLSMASTSLSADLPAATTSSTSIHSSRRTCWPPSKPSLPPRLCHARPSEHEQASATGLNF